MEEEVEEPRRRSMPVERKSMWKTAEERRLSDLTRVLEWLERRQGRRQQTLQKQKNKTEMPPKTNEKEQKKGKGVLKQKGGTRKVSGKKQRNESPVTTYRLYSFDQKGKRFSVVSGTFSKENTKKSELDIKDAISLESTQRPNPFRRQSSILDPFLQDSTFSNRRTTLLRDWTSKAPDSSYERKLKSLMEKGNEPKVEAIKMLKPEEVLSCRYLRLSKNNIRTLLKLCRDAGLNVDIHPHMIEGEIDMKKIFTGNPNTAL